ncbi:hypothetical protein [Paenibacillus spongiae]|uniref:Uncharacterized protein n=1 Tax=Paenibacillus spongiae TaxID=2909671 RepID=A0ABY5SBF7_9BACL|nr:hypothetical protein [Paenibacillus spongiae]UVI30033.1 hypothetical protein L1F29_32415 [Paenibacillus spongiae]
MEKSERNPVIRSEGQNETNGDETQIILDGKATAKAPSEPSLMERTKEALENIGTKINGI